jgi:hypothetical protein
VDSLSFFLKKNNRTRDRTAAVGCGRGARGGGRATHMGDGGAVEVRRMIHEILAVGFE